MLKRLKPGQPIRRLDAATWNTFAEAAEGWQRDGARLGAAFGEFGPRAITVDVANTYSATLPQFAGVGFDLPLMLPTTSAPVFRNFPTFKALRSDQTNRRHKTAVLLRDLRQNEVGPAAVAGVIPAQITVNHASHLYAAPSAAGGSDYLETGWFGCASILWKESGTGLKWALLRLGEYWGHTITGKADSSIALGAAGTISIWDPIAGADTGDNLTNCYATGAAVTAGKWATVVWPPNASRPIVGPWEC